VDASARVLKPDGTPIHSMLAAGSDVDGVYGVGYAVGLALAFAYGIEAARTARAM
jgi:hypothetical protein